MLLLEGGGVEALMMKLPSILLSSESAQHMLLLLELLSTFFGNFCYWNS